MQMLDTKELSSEYHIVGSNNSFSLLSSIEFTNILTSSIILALLLLALQFNSLHKFEHVVSSAVEVFFGEWKSFKKSHKF